jgi:hypothetical protein
MLSVYDDIMGVPLTCRDQQFLLMESTTWPLVTMAENSLHERVDPGSHTPCLFKYHRTADWTNMRLLDYHCRQARIMRFASDAADFADRFGISSAYN